MYDQPFDTETVTFGDVTVLIEYFVDDTYRPEPWDEYDGNVEFWPVRGSHEKKPSERYLTKDRFNAWVYDIRDAHDKAIRESWCTGCDWVKGLTRRQIATRAVEENVSFWRAYLDGDWFYAGVVITVLDKDGEKTEHADSCWGFETFNSYHRTAGNDMARELAATSGEH